MSFVTQSATLVRQKALHAVNMASHAVANAQMNYGALKSLFIHLAACKGNPDLKIVYVDGGATASDGGNTADQIVADAACTLYAICLKKTGATATWFKITDHAATAATNGSQNISYKMSTAADDLVILYPNGQAFASGVVYTEDTTATGSTLNLLANRIDGFVIVGA